LAFCRFLRVNGFTIGVNEERDALLALQLLEAYRSSEQMALCLQTALCKSPLQLEKFPDLYKQYWRELDRAVDSKIKEEAEEKEQKIQNKQAKPSFQALKNWLYGNQEKEILETSTYSDLLVNGVSDYPEFEEKELKEIFYWVKKLVEKIAQKRSRRFQTTHQHKQLDLRRTIRQNITRHSEIIQLVHRKKKKNEINVVLLCDVSRSMELYSRFFLQFMFAFQRLFPKVQSFVFSTDLHPISKELTKSSLDQSIKKITEKVNSWSGGTNIGASLAQFNQKYAHKSLNAKTLVIILSDGWDTGDTVLIAEQMHLLQKKALQILWLNPLAASVDWQAEVAGMKAALPHIDLLLPFHNTESLKSMIKAIRL
ncbi:MAG: VWA domain-containing protein, partial [Bacteroidota bacterium]